MSSTSHPHLQINNPDNHSIQVLLNALNGSTALAPPSTTSGGSSPSGTVTLKPEEVNKLTEELCTTLAELAGLVVQDQVRPHSPSWYAGIGQTAGQSSIATFLQYFQTMNMVIKICNELQQLTKGGSRRLNNADHSASETISNALWGLQS